MSVMHMYVHTYEWYTADVRPGFLGVTVLLCEVVVAPPDNNAINIVNDSAINLPNNTKTQNKQSQRLIWLQHLWLCIVQIIALALCESLLEVGEVKLARIKELQMQIPEGFLKYGRKNKQCPSLQQLHVDKCPSGSHWCPFCSRAASGSWPAYSV